MPGDPIYDSGVFVDFLECVNALGTTVASTPASCNGNDGTASVTATGGIPTYTYSWNTTPVQSYSNSHGIISRHIYEVTVDDQGACTDPVVTSIEVVSDATSPTISINNPTICEGESVILTATPSTSGGNYLWTTGEITSSITVSPNTSTTYNCDYDLNGCNTNESTIVNVNPVAIGTDTQTACDSYVWH